MQDSVAWGAMTESGQIDRRRYVRLFQQPLCLWVVDLFDLFVIDEVFLDTLMLVYLEASFVECILVFSASNVMDKHRASFGGPLKGLWFAYIGGRWKTSITGIFVVIEVGNDMVKVLRLRLLREGCLVQGGG